MKWPGIGLPSDFRMARQYERRSVRGQSRRGRIPISRNQALSYIADLTPMLRSKHTDTDISTHPLF